MENTYIIEDSKCVNTVGYKELIKKLRLIEKKQKNDIREMEAKLTWSNTKLVSARKELEFYMSPEYKLFIEQIGLIASYLMLLIGIMMIYAGYIKMSNIVTIISNITIDIVTIILNIFVII
jgi:hypothetical protein